MKNGYEVRGDVTAIIIKSPKYGYKEVMISTSKLEKVKNFPGSWSVVWSKQLKSFYCKGNIGTSTKIYLHRWITDCPGNMQVDHRNNDTLDNEDENLRVATSGENHQNRSGANRNSKSGVRGVFWDKQHKKWQARFELNGKKKHVGLFVTLQEAESAVKLARSKYMPFSKEAQIN